jgi:hypothetical protein
MAIFRIKTTDSVFTSGSDAFFSDTPGADTLIVDPGAYVVALKATQWLCRRNPTEPRLQGRSNIRPVGSVQDAGCHCAFPLFCRLLSLRSAPQYRGRKTT